MGTGYTRNDTANNIADGNVINASDLDGEFDAIQSAFNATTGHSHDGTTGEGPQIDTAGLANDAVTAAKLDETATFTMAGLSVTGNTTLGDAATDTVTVTADVASNLIPSADGTYNLGASGSEWQDLYIDGTANIDSLVADTADINGGSVDGVTIGTNSAVTELQVDNINVNGNAITSTDTNGNIALTPAGTGEVDISKVDIDGGAIDAVTIGTNSAVTELQVDNINVNGNAITSTDTNGNIALTPNGTGEVDISKVDIDGGAIDGTTIGGATAAAGTFTTLTGTSLDINGSADVSGTLSVAAKINHTGDTDTFFEFSAANTARIATGNIERLFINNSGIVINETGADYDFRVEGDTASHMLFVDAGNDRVGIANSAPATALDVTGTVTATGLDVNGAADISGNLSVLGIDIGSSNSYFYESAANNLNLRIGADGPYLEFIDVGSNKAEMGNSSGDLGLTASGTEKATLTSTGLTVIGSVSATSADFSGGINVDNSIAVEASSGYASMELGGPSGVHIDMKAPFSDDYDARIQWDNSDTKFIIETGSASSGEVEIRHQGSAKLNTSSTGVDITGELQADSLDIDGNATFDGGKVTITRADNGTQLALTSTDADSSVGPRLDFIRDSSSPADNDILGGHRYLGENSASEQLPYAEQLTFIRDATDGTEDGEIRWDVRRAGTLRNAFAIGASGITVNEDSVDADFRVESNGDANMFFVDGGNNKVGIGTNSPSALLEVDGNVIAKTNTDTTNSGNVQLNFGTHQNHVLTLTGNVTLTNPSTEVTGQTGFIIFIQDSTGSRTVSLGTDYETAGGAGLTLSTAANSVDIVPYVVQSSGNILLGAPQLAFS